MRLKESVVALIVKNRLTLPTGCVVDAGGTEIDLAELAAVNSIGAADLAKIDGITNGTGAAGKALVLSSGGDVTMPAAGILNMSREALAAAGSGQSDAAVITQQITLVTGADNAVGVALPAATTTEGPYLIVNTVANKSLLVYPVNSGNDAINSLTAGTGVFTLGPGKAAWFTPTSATQWYVEETGSAKAQVLSATKAVSVAENGSTFYLSSATEFVSTLPAPFLGARYTFIVAAAPSGASYTVVTNGSSNIIKGNQNSVAGDAGDFGTSDDTISFVDGQSVAGDKVELFSDGTSWFAYAISKVAAGVTFTTAS